MGHATAGAELDALAARGETKRSRGNLRSQALRSLIGDRPVVYAIRLDDGIIKIGCTRDLAARLKTLKCYNRSRTAEIVGFQFGDEGDERAIHAALGDSLAHGDEYYHQTAEVLAVVNDMREGFGLPLLTA